ncbi:metal ABC transporter permease, partial [Candidatus Micrarchaeota archaeon CG11_big_fil_rev_8_21_14_0_20_47_5]
LSYLFGSILSIEVSEMALSGALALLAIAFVSLFYHELIFISFDEEAAKISGTNTNFLNYSLAFLTALVVVGAMPIIGLLLSASLIVLPAASALLLKTSFKKTLFFAALFASVSVAAGLFLSYYLDTAPSGSIVLANAAIFAGIFLIGKIKK